MSFDLLGLSAPILKALKDQGYENPTPIQEKAIPPILEGRDIMAAAQTGTGKTAGFTLPMLEKLSKGRKVSPNHIRALVLTPTRELAHQVSDSIASYSKHLDISSTVVYGGVKINPQMMKLRRGIDILVATPGRLLDLHNQNAVKFNQVEMFVLDEADRMLDMGFIHDIKKLIAKLPRKRQNLMFSATFSSDIRGLAKKLINDPVEVSVSVANSTTKLVEQLVHPVDKSKKTALLAHLIVEKDWQQVLVFMRTKHSANRLVKNLLSKNIEAVAIHGNKSQNARMKALSGFKDGEFRVLVATDIVARGLDIEELPQVVNYDLPKVSEDYVHRIGRTGRAGKTGEAVSFVTVEDAKELKGIERLIKKVIEREVVKGFEPTTGIKVSVLDTRPLRPKKPKKAKSEIQKTFKSDTKTSEVKTSRVSRPQNDYVQKGKIKNTKSDEKLDNTKRSYRKKK